MAKSRIAAAVLTGAIVIVGAALAQVAGDVEGFLAGRAKDCPGCQLTDRNLDRLKGDGANLAGASFEGSRVVRATFVRANLAAPT